MDLKFSDGDIGKWFRVYTRRHRRTLSLCDSSRAWVRVWSDQLYL